MEFDAQEEKENFITVVSVGTELPPKCDPFALDSNSSGYVTVLTIGDSDENSVSKDITEEVLVYRLPGERLGFGLKFEGGTKANEFVKRLFIQSCAPDSPASRVQSTWGKLTEGDEVLEIDCSPINAMTRIDCVRCLKDSNVVIKLLVKHICTELKSKSVEDLPQIISAEKKRIPPPPPPVPPRKIPKKFYKNNTHQSNGENPVPAVRQINTEASKNKKFQSPRSSGRASQSPDAVRRGRRFSDGSLGPPDAEVYVDLFSQESTQSLSESDDTGSSISTVVDRFGSFPTTTTSSLAGSLPSTPTSVQKQIDFSNLLNYEEDDFLIPLNRCTFKQSLPLNKHVERIDDKIYPLMINEDGTPLQPPSCFQDAPLSYGNEDMRIETKSTEINSIMEKKSMNNKYSENIYLNGEKNSSSVEDKVLKKPPVPPRTRDLIYTHKLNGYKDVENIHDENMNISNLPRLVDFVPKPGNPETLENPVDIINKFLDNERRETDYLKNEFYGCDDPDENLELYGNDLDVYSSKWSISSHLATIGEDEEEGSQCSSSNRSPVNCTPIVIVENADDANLADNSNDHMDFNGKMETLPSDSRQPPDGHEFPDYVEISSEQGDDKIARNSYIQLNHNEKVEVTPLTAERVPVKWDQNSTFNVSVQNMSSLSKASSVSNCDLSARNQFGSGDEVISRRASLEPATTLHTRSQSLIDMSAVSQQKNDHWRLLVEQRRRGYSKLKGLVIPEHTSENDASPTINIPEIVSHDSTAVVVDQKNNANETAEYNSNETEPVALPLTSPPWISNTGTFPKYSPAFKRKSLEVYSQPKGNKPAEIQTTIKKFPVPNDNKSATFKTKLDDDFRLDNLSDSPKSLESITSPTMSDCSFDYVTNTSSKKKNKQDSNKTYKESFNYVSKLHKDIGKSEDESDNDSAVSSSQSSYISKCSPPPSPTRSCEMVDYDSNMRTKSDIIQDVDKYGNIQSRLLKAASVEAINRKNILASAKCRSGRDLKVGSPVIQRKYDSETTSSNTDLPESENPIQESSIPKENGFEAPMEPPSVIKEERSLSREESSEPVLNGDNVRVPKTKSDSSHSSLNSKPSQTNTLVVLKPVAHLRTSKEFKLPVERSVVKPYVSLRNNNKPMSVNDLRKSFEKFDAPPPLPQTIPSSTRRAKEVKEHKVKTMKPEIKPRRCDVSLNKDKKSIEEIRSLDKDKTESANLPNLESSPAVDTCARTIVLHPEFLGGSIGITLAGGTDYETKEITVHRIRYGSAAYTDGQLKKGDRIISVNGKSTANLTHAESVELLKEPVSQFTLIVEDGKEDAQLSPQRKSFSSDSAETKLPSEPAKASTHVIALTKNNTGLGFSIEGGKDSPFGDLPIRVKKIFQGGLAEKSGELCIGDELLAINEVSLTNLSRIEAWSLMKKLPDGNVNIHIHR